jgi:protein-tyrosine phosphatase
MIGGILQRRFEEAGLADQLEVTSAGVYGLSGEPASPPGVELLAKRNIDISGHIARPLEDEEILAADLVIVMEESHRQVIVASLPEARYKVVLFSELADRSDDMEDPYRQGPKAYRKTLATIDSTLDVGWNRLLRRLQLY